MTKIRLFYVIGDEVHLRSESTTYVMIDASSIRAAGPLQYKVKKAIPNEVLTSPSISYDVHENSKRIYFCKKDKVQCLDLKRKTIFLQFETPVVKNITTDSNRGDFYLHSYYDNCIEKIHGENEKQREFIYLPQWTQGSQHWKYCPLKKRLYFTCATDYGSLIYYYSWSNETTKLLLNVNAAQVKKMVLKGDGSLVVLTATSLLQITSDTQVNYLAKEVTFCDMAIHSPSGNIFVLTMDGNIFHL